MGKHVMQMQSSDISLLDCTLRDGGYQNNWIFGYDSIRIHVLAMIKSGINFVEIGFLDQSVREDLNRCVFPSLDTVDKILKDIDKGKSQYLVMIDFGNFDINSIPDRNYLSVVDGIRVIAKMENAIEAIKFTSILRTRGYLTFFQIVSSGEYTDEQLFHLSEQVNLFNIDYLSIVDTYGQMYPSEILNVIDMLDSSLQEGIGLGFHGHNNIQLAYANSITAIESKHKRTKIIDGTLLGMGKNAGNCPLELLVDYVVREYGGKYNIGIILDLIEIKYNDQKNKYQWGYSNKFYLSATKKIHPNYVSYLMDKRTLLASNMIEILSNIPKEKQLRYDNNLIASLYLESQSKFDNISFKGLLDELQPYDQIELIAPGPSLLGKMDYFKRNSSSIRISVNYIPSFPVDYVLITNSRRYMELFYDTDKNHSSFKGIILTNNVLSFGKSYDYLISYQDNIELDALFIDNPLFIIGNFVRKYLPSVNLNLLGFDGYDNAIESNYIHPDMEYSFTKDKAEKLNKDVIEYINKHNKELKIIVPEDSKYFQVIESY